MTIDLITADTQCPRWVRVAEILFGGIKSQFDNDGKSSMYQASAIAQFSAI